MEAKPRSPEEVYGPAQQAAQRAFEQVDPAAVAARAGVTYHSLDDGAGWLEVPFFGTVYSVDWPGGAVVRVADQGGADIATRLILLHYLITADGTPLAGRWIAFRNLPGGLGYDGAFQGRANLRLARAYGSQQEPFEAAARSLSGERLAFGNASFLFRLLPRVWLAVVLHMADEEFPANANVLFDASSEHYLPTEDLAVLGGMLASRLVKAGRQARN
jgi:hypothetical protein